MEIQFITIKNVYILINDSQESIEHRNESIFQNYVTTLKIRLNNCTI